jgi:ABC-2 type transport system ATP-binding protein
VALDGIDLDLEGAGLVGIVGPDGAGKTTLLRAIAGLLEIEAERASVLGVDLREDVRALKARTGYVPQAFSLQPELSIRENLAFTARLHRLGDREFATRSADLLERTSLAPFADRPAGALSGGMKQKLAVANALLPEPDLLILDEPTAGVDVVARAEIREILDERRRETLILLATSYVEEAAACDRLVYLDAGRVVAEGSPDALCEGIGLGIYRLWGDAPETLARAARELAFVEAVTTGARFARVEASLAQAPDEGEVLEVLGAIDGLRLAERADLDLEATLVALARRGAGRETA